MDLLLRKNGQSILELVVIINLMLFIFFGMIMYGVYLYDKMVVLFAANLALDEGIGKIPTQGLSEAQLQKMMVRKAASALRNVVFLQNEKPKVICKVKRNPDNTGFLYASVQIKTAIVLPFVEKIIPKRIISHVSEVDYSW
jgi:hypothetical protein